MLWTYTALSRIARPLIFPRACDRDSRSSTNLFDESARFGVRGQLVAALDDELARVRRPAPALRRAVP
jgi:hypothetical protein